MDIEYKLADTSDLSAMIEAGDNLFDYPIKKKRAIEFLEDSRHHLFLAYDDLKLVGMVSALDYVHPDKDPNLFINEASVLEAYQNQGIGQELVKHMVKYGQDVLGCNEAWVATMQSNIQAQKAYVAAGGITEPEAVVMIEYSKK